MNDIEAISENLKRLMAHHGYTQEDVARIADISQKNVSNIINQRGKYGSSIGYIEKIAKSFKLATWHLLIPNCPDDLLFNNSVEKLVENFMSSDSIGRNATLSVSEIRAPYSKESKNNSSGK